MLSSEDEDDIVSSDEEGEHHVLNPLLEVVGRPGMLMGSFLEDEELSRTALSCHLSMDLLCSLRTEGWKLKC